MPPDSVPGGGPGMGSEEWTFSEAQAALTSVSRSPASHHGTYLSKQERVKL